MRNFFIILFCVTQIINVNRAHATSVISSTFPQQLVEDVSFVATKASSYATQISTEALKYDALIGRPLVTGMINIAQQHAANDIISWVNGGFQGDPLIINNPQKYFEQGGHIAAKNVLDNIPVDSIYGESIFGSLVSEYQDVDLEDQVIDLTSSDIPSIIQEDICDDAHLEELVIDDVKDADGNVDPALLKQKKQELYDYACTVDAKDPDQAAKLQDLSNQNSAIGGWDKWLAVTVKGDNPYNAREKVSNLAAKKMEEDKQNKRDEVYAGAGPVSQTKCIKFSATQMVGADKVCLEKVTLSPGESAASALERAANSGIDRLTNLTGEGLSGLITTIAMTKLTKGLNTAFTSTFSSSGSSGSGSNNGTVVVKKAPIVQDLAGDIETKNSVLSPMIKQLNAYSADLDIVKLADQAYLIDVNAYESRITTGRSCYDSLIENNIATPDNPQVTAAYDFYNNRQSRIDTIKNPLLEELRKVVSAKKLISDTISQINNSNSTQEISTIFNKYMATVSNNNYPNSQSAAQTEGDHRKTKAEADADKEIDTFQATCNQLGGGNNGGGDRGGI